MSRYIRTLSATAGVLGLIALTACSTGTSGGTPPAADGIPDTFDGSGQSLTVWIMQDDYNQETIDAITAEFEQRTKATANVEIQQWDGITTKLNTALSTATPPDVVDIGNTQVADYASSGALMDITDYKTDLEQGQEWLGGLAEPATIDGKLYGVPGFAGARAVIYNKTLWNEAGITAPPTTWAELETALDAVAAVGGDDFSPLYLPGQHWYVGMQFIWDRGGELAVDDGGTWSGAVGDSAAQEGLADFAAFQNTYSSAASRTVNTDSPEQEQIFADGKTSAIIASNGAIGNILAANPELTEADLGTFALPGREGGTQPAMLGGSDWGIAAKSQNPELALIWAQIASSPEIQEQFVFGSNGWIPNSTQVIDTVTGELSDTQRGFFEAALNSRATPASPGWAAVEGTNALQELFSSVASGSSTPAEAAEVFDAQVDEALNK